MSMLTRWEPLRTRMNPFRELEEMEKRLSTIFGRPSLRPDGEKVPEIKKEDIKLLVQDNVLTISGERKSEKEEKGKKYHRVERTFGSFMRSFTLPEDADGSKVAAEYKDGMLNVRLPKSEKAKPKSIEVKVS